MKKVALSFVAVLMPVLSFASCSKSPCLQYCEEAMRQIVDCGLLVDDDEVFDLEVDACVQATRDADRTPAECRDGLEYIQEYTCDDWRAIVCETDDPNLTCDP